MNKHYLLLLLDLPLAGCLSSKVGPTQEDAAFMLVQDDGQPRVSSLNSAIQTRITRQEKAGDTLLVTYRNGAFLNRASAWTHSNVLLDDQTKYVQCANRLFRVKKAGPGFTLEPVEMR